MKNKKEQDLKKQENKNREKQNYQIETIKEGNKEESKEKSKEESKEKSKEESKEKSKEEKETFLIRKIDELNQSLTETNLLEILELLGKKRRVLWLNLIAGISRGIGIGIGVTIITAILVILLQKIVTLNIPVIGEYIADIVEIVQKSR